MDTAKKNDNPFVVTNNFGKDFIESIRNMFIEHLILKDRNNVRDLEWEYFGGGIVEYTYTDTVHHAPGYHMVGSNGFCDFASFSEWDEDVLKFYRWNVVANCHAKEQIDSSDENKKYIVDTIKLMDLVFKVPREKFNFNYTLFDYAINEVLPAFNAIKKYW